MNWTYMGLKILILFACFFSVEAYTQSELNKSEGLAFAKTYLEFKEVKAEVNRSLMSRLTAADKDLMKASIVANLVEATPLDKEKVGHIIKECKDQNQTFSVLCDASLKQLCSENKIDESRYKDLSRRFKSDVKFQHEVRIYFDQVIKTKLK